MICKLFVFRHSETFDNRRGIFSGWRDSKLTSNGLVQAKQIAEQLERYRIDYAFTSHLRRAQKTLEIVLETHPPVPVFVDDRLIERCYGLLQGKSKRKIEDLDPEWYAQFHRGYELAPTKGESLKMVEKRVIPFLNQLKSWLGKAPGNVVISCHSNSIRPIRRVFENLSLEQMLHLETPQDLALIYKLQLNTLSGGGRLGESNIQNWAGMLVSRRVKLSTDPSNPLKKYYDL
ncbi:histidine phosphatase family protein [Candidatus Bathyarchaeota archaeon]|nr:histidine phosphatase family protein [Candidatus Bathyarchaeota archaeon]